VHVVVSVAGDDSPISRHVAGRGVVGAVVPDVDVDGDS